MAQTKGSKKASSNQGKRNTKDNLSKKRSARGDYQANKEVRGEVLLISFFVLCALMLLSCFGICGKFGNWISNLLFGLFGFIAYIIPIALFFGVCFYVANRKNMSVVTKFIAGIAAVLLVCALLHGIAGNKELENLGDIYEYCMLRHNGGGWIGAALFRMLSGAFGTVGAFIVLFALLIIEVVIISEKSFVKSVKKGSKKVYATAKEENAKRKERAQERRAEKRRERKASGVNMNVKLEKDAVHKEDMTELTESEREEIFLSPEMSEIPTSKEKPKRRGTFKEQEISEIPVTIATPVIEEAIDSEPVIQQSETEYTKLEAESEFPVQETKTIQRRRTKTEAAEEVQIPEIVPAQNVQKKQYQFPPLRLLAAPKGGAGKNSATQLRETAAKLQQILKDFGVNVTVTDVSCGPTVTRYELQPDQGVKVSKVLALADDIKLNLAVADIRIEAPIPGKAAIGIEVPNKENSTVTLRELLASEEFDNHTSNLAFAVGKDIGGKTIITDIAKMPHLLIAGATGSGKSVCINTLIISLLYKASPEDVKVIMVDPKVVELSSYNGIPHLLIPVVTDPKKAAGALNWAVAEMTRRYQLFADYQVRNLQGYNEKVKSIEMLEDEDKPQKLPQIVIIVDELADLMMVAPGDVEDAICRLAQLARAAGIHLIIATQRPSVNVITGLIKANMPSRLAFAVSSGVDSRTILDMNGAEKLLGKGDMLFYPYGFPKPVRIQGAFVSDEEVSAVVNFLKEHNEAAVTNSDIEEHLKKQQNGSASGTKTGGDDSGNGNDPLFEEAGKFIIEKEKASIGMLQRWFKIGFNRAARIMDQLAQAGVVGEEQGTKPREILMSLEQFEQYIDEYL